MINGVAGSTAKGNAYFEVEKDGRVFVRVMMWGLTPGKHGVSLANQDTCDVDPSADAPYPFNPTSVNHCGPDCPTRRPGDFGNLDIHADGAGTLTLRTDKALIWRTDGAQPAGQNLPPNIVGRPVIIYAGEDDGKTQPAGMGREERGKIVACGIIQMCPEWGCPRDPQAPAPPTK